VKDYSGFVAGPRKLSFIPRGGQWVMLKLRDSAMQAALAKEGAHASRDGSLVAIFCNEDLTPELKVTKGKLTYTEPPQYLPPRFHLVYPSGQNFGMPQRDPQQGRDVFADVMFAAESPAIASVTPIADLRDMPPGRVVHTRWAQAIDPTVSLPEEMHAQAQASGLKVSEILALKKAG
jgi:hypothetical protein